MQYAPPVMIPETNCENPCQYGYSGSVVFETGTLTVGCQEVSGGLSITLDSTSLFGPGRTPITCITIEVEAIIPEYYGLFCKHDFGWWGLGTNEEDYQLIFTVDPEAGTSKIHLIPLPSFWEKFSGEERFEFQLGTQWPIPIQYAAYAAGG